MAETETAATPPSPPEQRVSRPGATTIDGVEYAFTTTAATVHLRDAAGKERARLFTISHVLDRVEDPATRPVTFCFNGGPGSSSVWLHYGAFGPRRVDMPDLAAAPPPPLKLVDNAHGLLDKTDLVFIDPVGTGFSRPLGEEGAETFHSIDGDIESIGELIRRWLDRNGRWASPRYLAGESYGTTRAAGLAGWLQERGVALNGVILVSLATDFQNFVFEPGNDLPYVLYLPGYAATAAYHGRLDTPPEDLAAFLAEVERFAIEEYAPALLLGARLPASRRESLARVLAGYTGLPAAQIERRRLRIPYYWFMRTVLGEGHRTVGRLDARYTGPDLDPYGQEMTRDPSYDAAVGAFTAAVNDDLRRRLGWEEEAAYEVLSRKVNQGWKWERSGRKGFPSTTGELRAAMIANPHLRVLICNGLYDLATPLFAARHSVEHLLLPDDDRHRVTLCAYPAGHMMYFHPPSLVALKADIAGFIG